MEASTMATIPLRRSLQRMVRRTATHSRRPDGLVRRGLCGAGIALGASASALALAAVTLHPSGNDLIELTLAMAESGALALALVGGLLALGRARPRMLRPLWLKLAMPPVLTAVVIAVTILALAHDMFISNADGTLLLIFLIFAVALALAMAGMLAMGIGGEIVALEIGARRMADGEYAHRVPVPVGDPAGTDELGRLAAWFNQMAARVQEAFARRDAVEAERRHLIAALSHDLRTPITSLRAMLEAIADGVTSDPDTVERYHQTMRVEVLRLSTLMNELFEMARLDAGDMQLRLERMGIEDLLSDALGAFHEPAMRRGVTLMGHVQRDLPLVSLDPSTYSRALANVLQNALRYTPSGGAVVVRGRLAVDGEGALSQSLVVEVADTGPGIAPQELARIFARGYRGEAARDRSGQHDEAEPLGPGAGLGLSITRALMGLHGGQVWVVSPVPPAFWRAISQEHFAADSAPCGTLVTLALPLSARLSGRRVAGRDDESRN
jgi:signal transduction histidine kinase